MSELDREFPHLLLATYRFLRLVMIVFVIILRDGTHYGAACHTRYSLYLQLTFISEAYLKD
jgi:hypothetical protein